MNKVIFLDRDGTINIDFGYVFQIDKLEFMPGVTETLKKLQDAGYMLIIVTNQSGIARGYFSKEDYDRFTQYLLDKLQNNGIEIKKVYMCPHADSDNCTCRKPKTELFETAGSEFDIDWNKSYAIGDKERDLSICKSRPVKGILLSDQESSDKSFVVKQSWEAVADYILKENL